MQTVGEKEHYEKEADKIYKEIRGSLLYHVNSILVGGRTDVTVSPIITNAIIIIVDRLQDAVKYQIRAELAKHGISSLEEE